VNIIKPELLSPAGSMASALAAINAGADALYLGGKNFSARSAAQNFSDEEIIDLIGYAMVRNVRIFIAVNTLYKNHELPRVLDFVSQMHSHGAAAFILQDPGLAYILKNHYPQLELHASTQMTIHSTAGANCMEKMGFSRVVLSRELSLAEIAEINAMTRIECEVFIHGALCISYSGQCLMSSLIGGRSGNRGKCAQICRTRFKLDSGHSGYLLSPKDMMTLDILDAIVATGVACLKIEGRMKSPEYVYLVTEAYRKKLDSCPAIVNKAGSETYASRKSFHDTEKKLLQIFNRGGSFSTGYYNCRAGINMMSTITPKSTGVLIGKVDSYKHGKCKIKFDQPANPGDGIEIWTTDGNHVGTGISKKINAGEICEFSISGALESGCAVYKSYDKWLIDTTKKAMVNQKKITAVGNVKAIVGDNLELTLAVENLVVKKIGPLVESAQKAPMCESEIIGQLSKTGNTPFVINFTETIIDDNIFISKALLNRLRRDALEELEISVKKITSHLACVPNENASVPTRHMYSKMKPEGCKILSQHEPDCDTLPPSNFPQKGLSLSVQITNINHLTTVLAAGVSRVYVNITDINHLPQIIPRETEIFATLPFISRNTIEKTILFDSPNVDGYLVSTYGQLQLLQNCAKKIMLNYSFNIFNNHAAEYFTNQGYGITLSQELNIRELTAIYPKNFELIVYGRQTLMTTHNCPIGLYAKCGQKDHALRDKMMVDFPILADCHNCTAHILNGKTLDVLPKFQAIKNCGASSFRLIFTTEDEKTVCDTISRYKKAMQDMVFERQGKDTTYGHFFRGVE